MKFIDLAKNIDKSEQNKVFFDLEDIGPALGVSGLEDAEQDSDRLQGYHLETWYDDEGWAGGRIYFLDDEPVAYAYKIGYERDERFAWASKEAAEKTRSYLLSFLEKEELNVSIFDINEDMGDSFKIPYVDQVIDWSKARYNGHSVEFLGQTTMPKNNPQFNAGTFDDAVRIRISDTKNEVVVYLKELDFLYNLKDNNSKLVDEILQDASVRSAETISNEVVKGELEME